MHSPCSAHTGHSATESPSVDRRAARRMLVSSGKRCMAMKEEQ